MLKNSFSIFSCLLFLLLNDSNCLNLLNPTNNFSEFNQINLKDEEKKIFDYKITINIKYKDNQETRKIGEKGTLYYITDYNDNKNNIFNSSDIEERTTFQTFFTEENTKYYITCRLWKPNHENLRLFCKLKDFLEKGSHYIKINNANFNYGNYNILINFDLSLHYFYQMDYFPFLYSDEQIINVDYEKDSYYLKFNIESYDNDMLFVGGKFLNTKILNNCKINEKELICEIKKEDLVEILQMNGGNIFLYYFCPDDDQIKTYPNVFTITVNIKNLKKEDIYVGITKLLINTLKENNFVAYESNVTNISNIITEQYKIGKSNYTCYLKKDPDKPLLMLCTGFTEGNYTLKELINEK